MSAGVQVQVPLAQVLHRHQPPGHRPGGPQRSRMSESRPLSHKIGYAGLMMNDEENSRERERVRDQPEINQSESMFNPSQSFLRQTESNWLTI